MSDIHNTICIGIRSRPEGHARVGNAALRPRQCSTDEQISDAADRAVAVGQVGDRRGRRGARLFAENCAACHGDEGKGDRELGAPNLTDAIWLYGAARRRSSKASGPDAAA